MVEPFRLYDLDDSPYCMKARICLHLKKVPYRRVPLTVARLGELRRLNMLAKVPVLVGSSGAIADSSLIARVLEEQYPKPALMPKDADARAYCSLMEDWADESLGFVVGAFKWLNPRNRRTADLASAQMAGRWPTALVKYLVRRNVTRRFRVQGYSERALPLLETRMRDNLDCLTQILGDKPFVLGKYATLADIAIYAQLAWMRRDEEKRLLDKLSLVKEWMARLDSVSDIQAALGKEKTAGSEISA